MGGQNETRSDPTGIGRDENARLVLFRYGAIVCLDQKGDKGWAVRWILTPEIVNLLK
jgi:hypothetical protein